MKEERYFYVPDAASSSELPQEEAVHAIRVLRLTEGDHIFLMDGMGTFFKAEVTMTTGKHCSYQIIDTMPQNRIWNAYIHLAMAPTKMMDRVEWMAEKATEIGIDEFSFLECKFSERRKIREDRIEKIVVAATKQSRKPWKPKVNPLCSFKDFVTQPREGIKFICHCYDEIERKDFFDLVKTYSQENNSSISPKNITVLVGPEGDFSIDEVRMALENGYQSVSLGKSRLRTETAALSAIMMAQLGSNNNR